MHPRSRAGIRRLLPVAGLTLGLALAGLGVPAAAAGQASDTWVSAWGGVFMDPGSVRDGESGTVWDFGTSFVAGAGIQRYFGGSLAAGLDLGYSPMRHEVRDADTGALLDEGRAHVLTAMAVGRLGGRRGTGFSYYTTGGAGVMTYGIPSLERWDLDPALRAGGGLQYGTSRNLTLFLEWNRWWVFHQSDGVDDNTVRHSHLEIGARYGL